VLDFSEILYQISSQTAAKRAFHENLPTEIRSLLKHVNGFLFLLYFFFVDLDKIRVEDLHLMVLNIFEFREKMVQ